MNHEYCGAGGGDSDDDDDAVVVMLMVIGGIRCSVGDKDGLAGILWPHSLMPDIANEVVKVLTRSLKTTTYMFYFVAIFAQPMWDRNGPSLVSLQNKLFCC